MKRGRQWPRATEFRYHVQSQTKLLQANLQAPDSSRRIQSNISDSLKLSIIQIYTDQS
jgi:hypothetical protein